MGKLFSVNKFSPGQWSGDKALFDLIYLGGRLRGVGGKKYKILYIYGYLFSLVDKKIIVHVIPAVNTCI